MRRRKNNDYFRIFFIIVGIIIISFVLFRGCKSIAGDICKELYAASYIYEDSPEIIKGASYISEAVVRNICTGEMQYLDMPCNEPEETSPQNESVEPQTDCEKETETTQEETEDTSKTEDSAFEAAAKVYLANNLLNYNYVLENFYVVPSHTTLREDILDLQEIARMNLIVNKNESVPQIVIFHTHSQEGFADTDSNGMTIVNAGNELTDKLREAGYNVIHLTDEFDMMDGYLDRGTAYTYANNKLDEVLNANPSIEVVIDLHRDGVNENNHLITEIDGKTTAKIMLFNGISYTNQLGNIDYLPNPYLKENLAMSYKMNLIGRILYPDLIRCIYIEGYRYCLHHRGKSMLIELGAQTNTYEEIHNAIEPLANMIIKTISEN